MYNIHILYNHQTIHSAIGLPNMGETKKQLREYASDLIKGDYLAKSDKADYLKAVRDARVSFGKITVYAGSVYVYVINDGITKADLSQVEEFHRFSKINAPDHPNSPNVSIMPVSDWTTGGGKHTKARSMPIGAKMHEKTDRVLPDYAKEFFLNRPRCRKIIALEKEATK